MTQPTDSAPGTTASATGPGRWIKPALAIAFALALNLGFFVLLRGETGRYWIAQLRDYSYIGVFLVTLLANATTIVPTPYIPIVACIAAQTDNLPLVIALGALGSALGESVAFFIGRSGRGIVQETRLYRWVHGQMRHPWRAFAVLFLFGAPPNPLFDVAGLAAGALGVPYWLFFSAVFLARIIRIWLIALGGLQWCGVIGR
ncbi:MAG: VTT domain-containing protein [Kouleothrix sp.]|nr:VTT domain-containing protein [Kouleothrix sp.]